MIDTNGLKPDEKLALVCLYYSQIRSDDIRYANKRCVNTLTAVANYFGFTYSKAKNDRDAFDALYDNGRKGWTDRPLEKRSRFLFEVYKKYGDLPIRELENTVKQIIAETESEGKPFFSIKTKEPHIVKAILAKKQNIVFDGLNILQDSLKIGQLVFIVLGGDKPEWDTGLIGMGVVTKEPYDIGYSGKNYRIQVDIKLLLEKAIKREDLVPYKETYGIIGIAPIVKWEPNQALSQIQEKNAIALMRAMLELCPSIEIDLASLIKNDLMIRIKGSARKYVEIEVAYGNDIKSSIRETLNNDLEEELESNKEDHNIAYDPYTKENFLKEVFMDEKSYDDLCRLIEIKKNVILQGPPGVGKTYAAKRLAYSILGMKNDNNIEFVQFHQSYSYEDFVIGYRPNGNGFELSEGPFLLFCEKARKSNKKFFFIIDEINRGNMSKIFGELLMLIEVDKRDEHAKLLYINKVFSVPENVYIIGMMNTADRSLAIIDYALRRRFSFFDLKPAFDSTGFIRLLDNSNNINFLKLINVIKNLNNEILKDDTLGAGFLIGHSYFCNLGEVNSERLSVIIEYDLIPTLKEYWFDEPNKVDHWATQLRGALV